MTCCAGLIRRSTRQKNPGETGYVCTRDLFYKGETRRERRQGRALRCVPLRTQFLACGTGDFPAVLERYARQVSASRRSSSENEIWPVWIIFSIATHKLGNSIPDSTSID